MTRLQSSGWRAKASGRRTGADGLLASARLALASVCALAVYAAPARAIPTPSHPFGIVPGSFKLAPSLPGAGAHADWTLSWDFEHNAKGQTYNDVRTIVIDLPPGFDASNTAVPACTNEQLTEDMGQKLSEHKGCPGDTAVGQVSFRLSDGVLYKVPLYNVEVTSFGVTAELGFKALRTVSVIPVNVRPGDEGITTRTPNIQNLGEPREITVKVWAVPASPTHDRERQQICESFAGCEDRLGGPLPASIPVKPFLANPTSCGMFAADMSASAWEEPLSPPSTALTEAGPIVECERVPFRPAIEVQPTTRSAESPSGLNVSLVVPQSWENPDTLATSNVRDAQVTLPQGYTVNPSAGNGLVGCTPAQYEAETASSGPGEGCPPESKLGRVTIETPLLAEPIKGSIYLAEPYDNRPEFGTPEHPGGSLLALYVVAKAPDRGIVVKSAGKVEADPVTGQLTSTFSDLPEQPFGKVTFELSQGATSPLVSPPACGAYVARAEVTPYSAPAEPRSLTDMLQIEGGIGGGPCPAGGIPPFKPRVVSGSQNNDAANYTPFYLRVVRDDGEQEITKFTTVLAPGLTANLNGIPFCSDAQIEAARLDTGRQELNLPSCPAASEIGHTLVGAGVGSVLAWTPGKVYLAGPYHGSGLSVVSVTSATVGPFDLGTVVIRFALRINPDTGQAEIDSRGSDPIPHIIKGIVVHVRDIHVYLDRLRFMLNPTSCDPMTIAYAITGAANPGGQPPVLVTTPFQAADCQNLAFKPSLRVSTSAKASRANGADLTVKLTYPKAPQGTQTNIRSVKVRLPRQLPSRLTTLQKACPDATFNANPAACPAPSRVGTARALTPILPVPLEGPAYFVSHGGAKFPELIVVLQGYGVTIYLHGETFISKRGITSSTFRSVPDEPVTSFQLTLPQGKYSALASNGNLCKTRLAMPTAFTAQNGRVLRRRTPIAVKGCPAHHKRRRKRK